MFDLSNADYDPLEYNTLLALSINNKHEKPDNVFSALFQLLARLPALEKLKVDVHPLLVEQFANSFPSKPPTLPVTSLICGQYCDLMLLACPAVKVYESFCTGCAKHTQTHGLPVCAPHNSDDFYFLKDCKSIERLIVRKSINIHVLKGEFGISCQATLTFRSPHPRTISTTPRPAGYLDSTQRNPHPTASHPRRCT